MPAPKSRSRLLRPGGIALAIVLPSILLFTAVSQAATGPATALTTSPPPTSPSPCPRGIPTTTGPSTDPEAPGPACRLAVQFVNNQSLVSWGASVDNVGVAGYTLHDRYNGVVTTYAFPGQGGTVDNPPTETHTYWVTAQDAAGNVSAPTAELTVGRPDYVDTTPPAAPNTLSANLTNGSVTLTWYRPTDDIGVTGYLVYDMYSGVTTVRQVANNVANPQYLVYPLDQPTVFHLFWVVARDAAGNLSRPSTSAALGRPVCPSSGPCVSTPPYPVPTSYPTGVPPTSPTTPTCAVKYEVASQWRGSFQGNVTITNLAATPTTSWILEYTFPDGQKIMTLWGGNRLSDGPVVTVSNASWNGVLQQGQSAWVGFIATWNNTANGVPTAFKLNGQNCAIAR